MQIRSFSFNCLSFALAFRFIASPKQSLHNNFFRSRSLCPHHSSRAPSNRPLHLMHLNSLLPRCRRCRLPRHSGWVGNQGMDGSLWPINIIFYLLFLHLIKMSIFRSTANLNIIWYWYCYDIYAHIPGLSTAEGGYNCPLIRSIPAVPKQ